MLSWKGIRFSWFKTVITSHKYILAWVGRLHKEIAALPTPTILLNNPAIKNKAVVPTFTVMIITKEWIFCVPENKVQKSNINSAIVSRALEG